MRELLKSKIYRARITAANPDYPGSIVIDRELMEKADIAPYEKVMVCDITNGNRWETYAIGGEGGSSRGLRQSCAGKETKS